MKKWMPFIVLACIGLVSSIVTVAVGIWAYLAVTGLDLIVTAKKTAPLCAVIAAGVTAVIWIITVIVLFVSKPYKQAE